MTSTLLDFVAPIFIPGDRPERFEKAGVSGADAVIIDLEDGVADTNKDAARANLRADFASVPVLVRVNAVGTEWFEDDVAAVERLSGAHVMVPKAEPGPELVALGRGSMSIVALVESARGLAGAREVASVPGVVRLAFGSIDYCADLGCAHTRDALASARRELVFASRLAGISAPLDGVTTTFDDPEAVRSDARYACDLGFSGKLAVHPTQVPHIMAGFTPGADEIAWAETVVSSGDGAVARSGSMVDEPVRRRAALILERAARFGVSG